MKARISIGLYLLFFSYRMYFWELNAADFINVVFNSLADTIVSLLAGILLFKALSKELNSILNKLMAVFTSLLLLLAASFILFGLHFLVYTLSGNMTENFQSTFFSLGFQMFDALTLMLVGIALSYAFLKNEETQKNVKRIQELIHEKDQAKLQFLKSQISPHFIFNTLNTINFSIAKENTKARELVMDLADLFRFQLYESEQEAIPIEQEIDFVKKYLRIHAVRMEENLQIEFNTEGDLINKSIPPLLIIPFIENSIKHAGNHSQKKSLISVKIKAEEQRLILEVVNTKGESKVLDLEKGGIGLQNVKKRLELLFSNSYDLEIKDLPDAFKVVLVIPYL